MAFLILLIPLVLLMIDSLLEVGLVGSMVGYLHHNHADVPYTIQGQSDTFELFPKPKHIIVNQGHVSNAAGGTAFVVVGVFGCIVLSRQRRMERSVCNLPCSLTHDLALTVVEIRFPPLSAIPALEIRYLYRYSLYPISSHFHRYRHKADKRSDHFSLCCRC